MQTLYIIINLLYYYYIPKLYKEYIPMRTISSEIGNAADRQSKNIAKIYPRFLEELTFDLLKYPST